MKTNNQYNSNNLSHRCNFINALETMAINSYGEVFKIGAQVGHEDKNAPNATIESFDVDKESNEIIAFTDKGFCHIDFMYNLHSDDGIVIDDDDAEDVCSIESTYGVEQIKKERISQIEKHGFTVDHDKHHKNNQLIRAAKFCLNNIDFDWPSDWDSKYAKKISGKKYVEQLAIAGALIAAEIDRIKHSVDLSPINANDTYKLTDDAIDALMTGKYTEMLKEENNG